MGERETERQRETETERFFQILAWFLQHASSVFPLLKNIPSNSRIREEGGKGEREEGGLMLVLLQGLSRFYLHTLYPGRRKG